MLSEPTHLAARMVAPALEVALRPAAPGGGPAPARCPALPPTPPAAAVRSAD
ncbi:MAG: hypothetical protein WKG07_05505 [Hymenobacter sp.]